MSSKDIIYCNKCGKELGTDFLTVALTTDWLGHFDVKQWSTAYLHFCSDCWIAEDVEDLLLKE